MKKKILSILITVLSLCTCMFTLTACGENEPPHTHTYSVLKYDTENHWYECTCGAYEIKENHNPGAEATETTDQKCTECGYVITPALGHVHALHLTKVDAKPQSCTQEGNREYYTCSCGKWFTNNSATTEITDKTSVVIAKDAHKYETLKKTATEHWWECSCGAYETKENHKGGTATCTEKAKCSVCNQAYGNYAEHTYSTEWVITDTYHYQESTCGCNVKKDYGVHVADAGNCCSTCDKVLGATTGIIYDISSDGTYAEVIDYEGSAKNVIIAEEYNGKPVKSIYDEAFKYYSYIKSVVIPDSVTSIGDYAFYECNSLTSVTIGNSITRIGSYVFSRCYSLTSITIPDSVTSIGYEAFSGCGSLTSVTIPDSVTSIGSSAFEGCDSLTSVTIGNSATIIGEDAFSYCNSSLYTTENNLKYVKANNNPYCILVGATNKNLSTYRINSQTKYIAGEVFYSCERLTQITIPDSVTSIGQYEFYGCNSLTSVNYTGTIDQWAQIDFCSDNSNPLCYANNLHINNELVTEVVLTSATKISSSAFSNCASLTSVVIPDSVTSIGSSAFYNCESLTSVTIGNSVTSIGYEAFSGCESLTKVNYTGTIDQWAQIDFYSSRSNPLHYAKNFYINDEIVRKVVLTSATKISSHAFRNCGLLTSVTIPDSVTSIGDYAFVDCKSLTSVTIPDSVTYIGKSAFYNCYLLKSIKYCGSREQWNSIVKGSYWDDYAGAYGAYTIIYNYAG